MRVKPFFYLFSLKRVVLIMVFLTLCILILLKIYPLFYPELAGVHQGVVFIHMDISGMQREVVVDVVEGVAETVRLEPENALLDLTYNRIIPEINGLEVNKEATVERIMSAPPGTRVQPVYREILPQTRWDEYPSMPAYQGNPGKNSVSFMINVAWGEEYMDDMLIILGAGDVKATFFITGKWAEKNPDLVKKIFEHGHELASHGYSDSVVVTGLPLEEMERSITFTNELLYEICGIGAKYFTPHKGEYNEMVLEVVSRHFMRTVMWTLDTVDWSKPGVEKMEKKISENLQSGHIILMHPTADTPMLLSRIIPMIKERGFYLVPVGEHLSPSPLY